MKLYIHAKISVVHFLRLFSPTQIENTKIFEAEVESGELDNWYARSTLPKNEKRRK